jgi:hypothetical protein
MHLEPRSVAGYLNGFGWLEFRARVLRCSTSLEKLLIPAVTWSVRCDVVDVRKRI